jgi:N-acetyl-anhydromuramoyl-L-alanine amidase
LLRHYPVREAVGHEHVAPVRKTDPGPGFDWARLARDLASTRLVVPLRSLGAA